MSSVLEIVVMGEDRASGILRGIGGALNNFGNSARQAGMDLLPLSAGAAVVAGGALKMAADYEQSMNVLQASTGASAAEMLALGKMAVDLGGDMTLPATSAKDAADAMLELSKAGLSVNDTMAAARGVLQLSAAAQISNSEAALITANALNMFRLSGDKATQVADLLAAGANKSSANIQQMADALQMSGNVAANAGLSIGDVTTAIALMANEGIRGSDAGTSIKQMLLSLQAPTKKSAELMADLGIKIYDANGTMLPMPQLIANFGGALGGLTQQQRNAALATIFGSDAVRAANVLLLGGTQAWNDMSAAVNAGGSAAEMAAAQNKGLKGALDGLRSVMETVLLTGAKPLLETLAGIVRWVGDLVGRFAEANPQLVTAGLAFAGVLAVASPLALGIGLISTALGALLAPVGLVVLAVGGLAAAWATNAGNIQGYVFTLIKVFQGWKEETGSVVGGIMGALGALGLMVPQLQPVIGVITTVVTWVQTNLPLALETLRTKWETSWALISSVFQTFIAAFGPLLQPLISMLQVVLPQVIDAYVSRWGAAWQVITDAVNTALTILAPIFGTIINWMQTDIPLTLAVLQENWQRGWDAVGAVLDIVLPIIGAFVSGAVTLFTEVWPKILVTVSGVLDGVWAVVQEVLGAIGIFMSTHGAEIQAFISTAWQAIGGIINTTLAIIQATVIPALQAIADFIRTHGDEIQAVFCAVWAAISGSINGALTVIQGVLKAALQVIQGDWSGAWETLKETGAKLWQIISDTITTIAAALGPILAVIWAGIKQAAELAWKNMKAAAAQKWDEIKAAIAQKLADMLTAIVKWLDDTLAKIESFTLLDAAKFLFGTLLPGIVLRLSEAMTKVANWLKDLFDKISKHDLKPATQTSFGTVVAGIAAKVPEILKNVASFLDKAAEKIKGYTFKSQTMTAIQTVIAGILSRVADILKTVSDFLIAIRNTIQSFSLFDAGAALIKGMIDGVKSMVGALVAAATGVVQSAIDAAKNLLGISSPSKVFAEIGREVMEGMILGIDEEKAKTVQTVTEAIAAICQAAVDAAQALRDFRPVDNLGVITAQIMEFLIGVETEFQKLVSQVNQKLAEKASAFAEAVEPVISLIATGVETLASLPARVSRLSWQEIVKSLEVVAWTIGVMAGQVTTWGSRLSDETREAAQQFAEAAGPVVDLVSGTLEVLGTLPKYVTRLSGDEVVTALETVAWTLGVMAGQVATWGSRIADDMQAAARKFAENAGPVVDLIGGALEVLGSLPKRVTQLSGDEVVTALETVAWVIGVMAGQVATWGLRIEDDMQAAARKFAENVAPVLDLISGGLDALTALRDFETLDLEARNAILNNMQDLNNFMVALIADLARIGGIVKEDLQSAARLFAENAQIAVDGVKDALETLAKLGEMQAPEAGLAWVSNLHASMTAAVPSLEYVLTQIVEAFHTASADLQTGAYDAGLSFMTSLADGLRAGLLSVEAALSAVAALFPHSPAKAGPLRVAPDWAAWMMGGMGDAAGMVSSALSWQMPRGLLAGGIGQSGGTTSNNTTVNINGPTIRDEMDIRRLADAVSTVLTNQQSTNRRLGATW